MDFLKNIQYTNISVYFFYFATSFCMLFYADATKSMVLFLCLLTFVYGIINFVDLVFNGYKSKKIFLKIIANAFLTFASIFVFTRTVLNINAFYVLMESITFCFCEKYFDNIITKSQKHLIFVVLCFMFNLINFVLYFSGVLSLSVITLLFCVTTLLNSMYFSYCLIKYSEFENKIIIDRSGIKIN